MGNFVKIIYHFINIFFQAWLVMISCFLVNGIIFGIINTFGILFVQLKKDMEEAGVADAATKCGENDDAEVKATT